MAAVTVYVPTARPSQRQPTHIVVGELEPTDTVGRINQCVAAPGGELLGTAEEPAVHGPRHQLVEQGGAHRRRRPEDAERRAEGGMSNALPSL